MAILRFKLLHPSLLASICRLSFSASIPHSSSLSTAISTSNALSPSSNSFAEFAATKFNLSSADIASILKNNRSLERLETLDGVERVVDMLKRYGCNQQQIASIMKKFPQLLSICPEKVVEPKIQLLRDLGIQGENVARILTRRPTFLGSSLQHSILPALAFLKNVYETHDVLIKAISKNPSILTYSVDKYLKPSVAFWEACGLTGNRLSMLLLLRPGLLKCTGLNPAKMDVIQKIGPDNGRRAYLHALFRVVDFHTEILEAKINNFQQLGLTTEETMELFRVFPYVFFFSEEQIRLKFDFIVSEMGLPPSSVAKMPDLLLSSLEKVVKPRLLVLQKMNSLNGDEHMRRGIVSIMRMSEAEFVSKVIKEQHESTLLNEIYQEALANALTKSKMKEARINISTKQC